MKRTENFGIWEGHKLDGRGGGVLDWRGETGLHGGTKGPPSYRNHALSIQVKVAGLEFSQRFFLDGRKHLKEDDLPQKKILVTIFFE